MLTEDLIKANIDKLRMAQFLMRLVVPLCNFKGLRGLRGLQVSGMEYQWVWDHTYLDDLITPLDEHSHSTGQEKAISIGSGSDNE